MSYTRWLIPGTVISQTKAAFRRGKHEVFVLWVGPLQYRGTDYPVRHIIVPAQQPGETPYGVYIHISGKELSRIQVTTYQRGERSVVQLHTHPSADVRMSDLDRRWEVVKHNGALSIIVPNYGQEELENFAGCNVYERAGLEWRLWSADEVRRRLFVT